VPNARMIVVGEDEQIRETTRAMFLDHGYEVDDYGPPEAALERLEGAFDVVVVSAHADDERSAEFARAIRALLRDGRRVQVHRRGRVVVAHILDPMNEHPPAEAPPLLDDLFLLAESALLANAA